MIFCDFCCFRRNIANIACFIIGISPLLFAYFLELLVFSVFFVNSEFLWVWVIFSQSESSKFCYVYKGFYMLEAHWIGICMISMNFHEFQWFLVFYGILCDFCYFRKNVANIVCFIIGISPIFFAYFRDFLAFSTCCVILEFL